MNYSIENLDVYRKSVTTGTGLCRSAASAAQQGAPSLAVHLEQRALSMVTSLAGGLGFWERRIKVEHFRASKQAVLETLPLLEVMAALGLMTPEDRSRLADDLRDMARMISGLLRGSKGPEKGGGGGGEKTAIREGPIVYH